MWPWRPKAIKLCRVVRRPEAYYLFGLVHTVYGHLGVPPLTRLPLSASPDELGGAVLDVNESLPVRVMGAKSSPTLEPFNECLAASGFKTPGAFETKSLHVSVSADGKSLRLISYRHDHGDSYTPPTEVGIVGTSREAIGRSVLEALARIESSLKGKQLGESARPRSKRKSRAVREKNLEALPNQSSASLVSALDGLGCFDGLTPERSRALETELERDGWLVTFADTGRLHAADAEDLAEGGVGELIRTVQPFLSEQGVELHEIQDDMSGDGYSVRINGVAHLIYTAAELARDTPGGQVGLTWGLSVARAFSIVDALLARAGSPERVYAVNGGNDLLALFLTPEMHRVIMEHAGASRVSGPYKSTDQYQWFGQPRDE